MKKTHSLVGLIFAAVTVVASVLHLILTDDPALVSIIMVAIVALSAAGMWLIPSLANSRILTLIPVLGLLSVGEYMKSMLTALGASLSEITDALPTYFQYETLNLMLTIAFVIAAVFALKKGYKWAVIVTTVYSAIMLLSQVQLALTYAAASAGGDTKTVVALMMMALAFVTAYATQVTLFTGLAPAEKEEPRPSVGTSFTADDSKQE